MKRRRIPQSEAAYARDAHLQWWYFDAVFQDGHRLLTYFLPAFRGKIGDHPPDQPYLNVVLKRPDGEIIRQSRSFPSTEFAPQPADFGAGFGEECSVTFEKGSDEDGLGRYLLRARAGRLGYDLTLHPEVPPWSPFGPRACMPRLGMMLARRSIATRDYMHYVPFVPRGRMEGQILLDGNAFPVRGTGYHEQGRFSFPLHEFTPAWYWLHIEHPPWTILTGTVARPPGSSGDGKETRGGFAYVRKGDKRLLAAADVSGLFVNWKRIGKRTPRADRGAGMAWDAEVRLARPGLLLRTSVRSTEVLEEMPFSYREETPIAPYWSQSIARADVRILEGVRRAEFEAGCVLETMVSGAAPNR